MSLNVPLQCITAQHNKILACAIAQQIRLSMLNVKDLVHDLTLELNKECIPV